MAWETEQMHLVTETISNGVSAVFSDSNRGQYWVAEDKHNCDRILTYNL